MQNAKFITSRGFTLMEILISMMILAALGVVGVAYLGGYHRSASIESEAEKITAYLRQVQNKALSGEAITGEDPTDWGVRFVNPTGGEGYYAIFRGSSFDPANSDETVYLPKEVLFLDPAASSTKDIVFQRVTGRPIATSTIILQSAANANLIRAISVNSLGQVSY